jgi:hypothetical protein
MPSTTASLFEIPKVSASNIGVGIRTNIIPVMQKLKVKEKGTAAA